MALEAAGQFKTISLDDSAVTIKSNGGMMAVLSGQGKGTIRIPLRQIESIEWRDASRLGAGYIRICVSGMAPLKGNLMAGVHVLRAAQNDANSVLFKLNKAQEFERIRNAIERAIP